MAATSVAASGIVLEALTKENYENWSTLVKNYLLGKDLWDVVVASSVPETAGVQPEETSEFGKKNAKALHIIQLACGSQNLTHIRHIETASWAWSKLSMLYSSKLETDPYTLQGVVEDNLSQYKALHMHVLRGDWKAAKSFIDKDPEAVYSKSAWDRTVLHIAVIAGHEKIVQELVKIGRDRLINIQDKEGYTALALAAERESTEIVTFMMSTGKGQDLLTLKTTNGEIPVLLAAAKAHKLMTRYLYSRTPQEELAGGNIRNGFLLLTRCITAGLFDVALDLFKRTPDVPLAFDLAPESHDLQALYALARMPSAFPSGSRLGLLQQFIYKILIVKGDDDNGDAMNAIVTQVAQGEDQRKSSFTGRFYGRVLNFGPVKLLGRKLVFVRKLVQNSMLLNLPGIRKIYDQKKNHILVGEILRRLHGRIQGFDETQLREASGYDAMLKAAKLGIVEFVDEMSKANPNLLWAIDKHKRSILSHAVMNRRKAVFQLIIGGKVNARQDIIKGRPDASGNTILHLAAYLGPSSHLDNRSSPALQMQREIQWFKDVESIVHPRCKETQNVEGKTPDEVFNESHMEMAKDAEKWAKDTAGHFTLVGTLIITIMFAAAFTVPGGNNQESGVPLFLSDKIFTAFILSDAISLFSASTSVLLFIGILTSRFDENDYLHGLPWKLFFGLLALFLSVVAMIFAFCSSLVMILKGHERIKIVAVSLGCVPVIVLVPSQRRLFLEIINYTIGAPLVIKKKQ